MSILSEANRIMGLRNSIRNRLVNHGIINNESASLSDCFNGLNAVSQKTSSDIFISGGEVVVPAGYFGADVTMSTAGYVVPVPSASVTALDYSGSAQAPSWQNYDSTKCTMSGTSSAATGGNYSTTFTLNNANQIWNDGTTTAKTISWSIQYVWTVWNRAPIYSYRLYSSGTLSTSYTVLYDSDLYMLGSSYSYQTSILFDSSTGCFTVRGRKLGTDEYDTVNLGESSPYAYTYGCWGLTGSTYSYDEGISAYIMSSSNKCIHITSSASSYSSSCRAYPNGKARCSGTSGRTLYEVYESYQSGYQKGTIQYDSVRSTDINAYPANSYSGNYWYVRQNQ